MAKRELEFTTRLAREDVAGLIEALVEGLKDGLLRVQKSDDVLELDVPRVVDLKIEAEIDEERAEFEIEVSWLTNRAGSPDTVPDEKPAKAQKKEDAEGGPKTAAKKAPAKTRSAKTGTGKDADAAPAAKKTPARAKTTAKPAAKAAAKPAAKKPAAASGAKKPATSKKSEA